MTVRYLYPVLGALGSVLAGCHGAIDDPSRECPPTMVWDAQLGECVPRGSTDGGDGGMDAGGGDTGGGDTGGSDTGGSDTGEGDSGGGDEPVDRCAGVVCGTNAYCREGVCTCLEGYHGDATSGCTPIPPCGADGCGYGAWCDQGLCRCKWGFSASADQCLRQSVGPPAQRTREEVCATWQQTKFAYGSVWHIQPQTACEWGQLDSAYHHAAMGTLNLYRWLVGLEAVASTAALRTTTQACATTLAAEDAGLTHSIPDSYACYTREAASGAAQSNLGLGVDAIDSVKLFIMDFNTPSLGHRRWIFLPRMQNSAFGYRDRYTCQYALSYSGSHNPELVAYPAPGFFPKDAIHGPWSVSSSVWGIGSGVEVEIVRLSDGAVIGVQDVLYLAGDSVRANTVSFRPLSFPMPGVELEQQHQVRLKNLTGSSSERSFLTTIVDCPRK